MRTTSCYEIVEDSDTDSNTEDGPIVSTQSSGGSDSDDSEDNGNNGGRYTGDCEGQKAPQYPDYCSDPKDLPEDSGYDDDDKTANCGGESCTPTEKEDSWLDEE